MRKLLLLLILCISVVGATAMDIDHPGVVVRTTGFNPSNDVYQFSCTIPPSSPGNQIEQRRFYAIDPIPANAPRNFYSTSPNFSWDLDPDHYTELVHTKELYHIYCEAQNYSAPAGKQNMASEIHIDLRTDDNEDVPDVYVLASEGTRMTMKCEPPDHVKDYMLTWIIRSRSGATALPEHDNKLIVNITLPKAGSGWDVVCRVFDKFTGKTSQWDMPIEAFESGPAYIPTIEGCMPNEPCPWVDPSGVPPPGTLQLTTTPETRVYLNEVLKGTTSSSGTLTLNGITPGIYNIVLRKEGLAELSTLVPIAAGKTTTRSYTMQPPQPGPDPWNMCHTTIYSLPASCTGGIITSDVAGGCRVITCSGGGNMLKVQACNKPTNTNPSYFEISRQTMTGSGIKICLGNTCIQNEGFIRSANYPICLGNGNNTCTPSNEVCNQRDDDCDGQIDEGNVCAPVCTPASEVCDGRDNDCDNQIDEGGVCTPTTNTTCYNSVQNIPATCSGATITSDTWNGGRSITCGTTTITAWNKAGYFEMYKQTGGSSVQLCIGQTCIKDNGYAKSANFPICTSPNTCTPSTEVCNQRDDDCDAQIDEGNVCAPICTPVVETCNQRDDDCDSQVDEGNVCAQTCYNDMRQMPATCTGTINSDIVSGSCRRINCATGNSSINVLSCNKPDSGVQQYFEMYRQSFSGNPPQVCIGRLCMQLNGYARSTNYPIC